MSTTPDNPSAFPYNGQIDEYGRPTQQGGLSMRDYFAAKAMHAFITNPDHSDAVMRKSGGDPEKAESFIALAAYRQADAMLAEREKGANK